MHSSVYTSVVIALCFGAVSSALPVPQSSVTGDVSGIVNAIPASDVHKLVSDTENI